MVNLRKVAVIGCGFVGASSAFALMQSGLFSEMVLIDADRNKAEGEALDISHGLPFARPMEIHAGDYDDISDASVIVVTAGAGQKPGETRLDLVKKNTSIFKSIMPEIAKRNCEGILLVVANPVVRICEAVTRDEKSILPVSSMIHGAYGVDEIALSLPAIVGRNGVESLVPIRLGEKERSALADSAAVLKDVIEKAAI